MVNRVLLVVLVTGLVMGVSLQADVVKSDASKAQPAVDAERVQELIKQLGSTKFAERQRAYEQLELLGPTVLPELRKGAQAGDLEIKRRCEEIVRKIQDKLTNETMLAPKRVRLNVKDMTVLDAVAELSKQSGYSINVMGDRAVLAERKITLDTGATTFWQAFDQLCLKAGLVENPGNIGNIGPPFGQPVPFPNPRPVPPIKIRPILPKAVPGGVLPVIPPAQPDQAPKLEVQAVQAVPAVAVQAQPAQPPQQGGGAPGQPGQAQPGQAGQGQAGGQAQAGQAQAAPPVQIQIAPAQPIQIQPIFNGRPGRVPQNNQQITVKAGNPKAVPTSYAGAVRIRILPMQPNLGRVVPNRAGVAVLMLDVVAEPRLQQFRIIGSPRVDKATDDQGQTLTLAAEQNPNPDQAVFGNAAGIQVWDVVDVAMFGQRQIPLQLKRGDKQAKVLKELTGGLNAEALTQTEAIITMANVMKAAGQTAKGKDGGALTLHNIDKQANGDIRLKLTMDNIPGMNNPFGGVGGVIIQGGAVQIRQIQIGGGNVVIGGMPAGLTNFPNLVDAKGQAYQFAGVTESAVHMNNGQITMTYTMLFRPNAGQGEPSQLVLNGQRKVTFQVPFSFKDVPLP